MARKKAAILDQRQLDDLLARILATNPQPLDMAIAFKLSYYAGLRVQEIAGLEWDKHIVDHEGAVRSIEIPVTYGAGDHVYDKSGQMVTEKKHVIFIGDDISKYTSGGTVPAHPSLVESLEKGYEARRSHWVVPGGKNARSEELKSRAHALAMRINRIYQGLGLVHCTSHSGRRSFITRAARRGAAKGLNLVDICNLARHNSVQTTQGYIDGSPLQAQLVTEEGGIWQ